jgi:hypothetical protein
MSEAPNKDNPERENEVQLQRVLIDFIHEKKHFLSHHIA